MSEFESLLGENLPALQRFVKFKISNKHDAEDVIQETCLAATLKFDTLRNRAAFKSWLISIANNKCTDYYREKAKRMQIPLDEVSEAALLDDLTDRNEQNLVCDTFDAIGNREKQILYLYFFKNLSQDEIARRLDLPLGTVKSRLHYAKEKFKLNCPISANIERRNSMKKITFIGAGSFGFARNLIRDLLTYEAFRSDTEFALMDIDPERLDATRRAAHKLVSAHGCDVKITATTDRVEALRGANGVVITVLAGGPKIFCRDIDIPMKYGININVGDTRGPSGIFRFLRTAPVLLDICRDIEKYAPDAIVLNYTNPMAMLCRYLQEMTTLNITGLCHSVQSTVAMLARWIGADPKDVTYTCAGINHQAFYLDYRVKGVDVYPKIRAAIENEKIWNEEPVRNEMFRCLDYYPTESSGHNSEYNAWFRKRPDLLEKYCTHGTNFNPGHHGFTLKEYRDREDTWKKAIEDWIANPNVDLKRGSEYASGIFNACFGDGTIFTFNGNVRNFGLIDNLPVGACVEVPVYASRKGIDAVAVGALPPQLALLIGTSAQIEELAVTGLIEGDRRKIYHACLFDPLTSALLSMEEIERMVDEMFEANRDYLADIFKY